MAPLVQPDGESYGSSFAHGGLQRWHRSTEFADTDVIIVRTDQEGRTECHKLHALVLANRSAFFHRALAGAEWEEARTKVVNLHLEQSADVWPQLVEFFYTDRIFITEGNVMPLMALARQLLVADVERYALDFLDARLCDDNSLAYLRLAVAYGLADVQERCTQLAASGFHLLYKRSVAGLPASTLLDILHHPDLLVHCEAQVLHFVLSHLATTQLEAGDAARVAAEVRYAYLDNATLASLAAVPAVPQPMLLAGCMARLAFMDAAPGGRQAPAVPLPGLPASWQAAGQDGSSASSSSDDAASTCGSAGDQHGAVACWAVTAAGGVGAKQELGSGLPGADAAPGWTIPAVGGAAATPSGSTGGLALPVAPPQPRPTYCCDFIYRMPGGCTHLTVEVGQGAIWEAIAAQATVRVSGTSEGRPASVLSADPDAWWESDESADPLPWIEVALPHNVTMVKMCRYSFAHGHRRSGYFRMRNWKTQTAERLEGGPLHDLTTRVSPTDQFEVAVALHEQCRPWQVMRLAGTDRQEDAVYRLCLRNLRVAGVVRIDLMRQQGGLVLTGDLMARLQQGAEQQAGRG